MKKRTRFVMLEPEEIVVIDEEEDDGGEDRVKNEDTEEEAEELTPTAGDEELTENLEWEPLETEDER